MGRALQARLGLHSAGVITLHIRGFGLPRRMRLRLRLHSMLLNEGQRMQPIYQMRTLPPKKTQKVTGGRCPPTGDVRALTAPKVLNQ